MAFHLKQQLVLVLLLWMIMSLSHARAKKPCRCQDDSYHDRRSNQTTGAAGFKTRSIQRDLGVVPRLSNSYLNNTGVLTTVDRWIKLWQDRPDRVGVDEASFNVTIVYTPLQKNQDGNNPAAKVLYSGIAFLILPADALGYLEANDSALAKQLVASNSIGTLDLSDPTSRDTSLSGSSISVKMGTVLANASRTRYHGRIAGVDITIHPPTPPAAGPLNYYSVWIDYDRVGRSLSVYVDLDGKPKPDNAITQMVRLNMSSLLTSPDVYFGVLCTVDQYLRYLSWNATIEDLPSYYIDNGDNHLLSRKVTLLSSILGSVFTAAMVAAAAAFYFSSRYRRWHRDLDQLARSMERLPGMPTKIAFADINKATRNFHESTKLGAGGFGTVYRCTLLATASTMGQSIEVAIKRFTRNVRNHRYDDFLAEVSIINRLRHKNIVPLLGWSYNKGEPLLVFQFMKNGSLDNHLFPRGGYRNNTRQRNTGLALRRWATRYEIVRDIATGLHYVHHEYEPMVLHRDIKASNIMLDSSLCARLGDFGLACTVAIDRNSATGIGGTWGYIAPEYAVCGKATRQTDIYALGVLILEVVTGQPALADQVASDEDIHIVDRVWRYNCEGRILECLDPVLITAPSSYGEEHLDAGGDAERLLLLGLACCNPNPTDRPTMPDVVRVIAKSKPPPKVSPDKPRFVWPPREEGSSMASNDDTADRWMLSYVDKSV